MSFVALSSSKERVFRRLEFIDLTRWPAVIRGLFDNLVSRSKDPAALVRLALARLLGNGTFVKQIDTAQRKRLRETIDVLLDDPDRDVAQAALASLSQHDLRAFASRIGALLEKQDAESVKVVYQCLLIASHSSRNAQILRDAWERVLELADEETCVHAASNARQLRIPLRRERLADRLSRGDRGAGKIATILDELELTTQR